MRGLGILPSGGWPRRTASLARPRQWPAMLREPIVQFTIAGLLIWAIASAFDEDSNRYRIDVDATQVARLADGYARQFGSRPSPRQLAALVDRYVEDEIAFREGTAMGLARDDEIVRRRIVQKYEFLTNDQAQPVPPSNAVLARWYAAHAAAYRSPPRTSFAHIYFSADHGGDRAARQRAERLLPTLGKDVYGEDHGDQFPGPVEGNDLAQAEIARIFGDTPLAAALPKLAPGSWSGPYRSGFGWHLVRVIGHREPATPQLADIRDEVLADYLAAESKRMNRAHAAGVRQRYDVRYSALDR